MNQLLTLRASHMLNTINKALADNDRQVLREADFLSDDEGRIAQRKEALDKAVYGYYERLSPLLRSDETRDFFKSRFVFDHVVKPYEDNYKPLLSPEQAQSIKDDIYSGSGPLQSNTVDILQDVKKSLILAGSGLKITTTLPEEPELFGACAAMVLATQIIFRKFSEIFHDVGLGPNTPVTLMPGDDVIKELVDIVEADVEFLTFFWQLYEKEMGNNELDLF